MPSAGLGALGAPTRVYAKVLTTGIIRPGDEITVESAGNLAARPAAEPGGMVDLGDRRRPGAELWARGWRFDFAPAR